MAGQMHVPSCRFWHPPPLSRSLDRWRRGREPRVDHRRACRYRRRRDEWLSARAAKPDVLKSCRRLSQEMPCLNSSRPSAQHKPLGARRLPGSSAAGIAPGLGSTLDRAPLRAAPPHLLPDTRTHGCPRSRVPRDPVPLREWQHRASPSPSEGGLPKPHFPVPWCRAPGLARGRISSQTIRDLPGIPTTSYSARLIWPTETPDYDAPLRLVTPGYDMHHPPESGHEC
jgi:hypothetical protein